MAVRDKWCQIRMTAAELAELDELVKRMKPLRKGDNRADVIRYLVHSEHVRMDRSEARSGKSEKSEE